MKKILLLLVFTFALESCGKKGPISYPGEQKRPKFDNVIENE